MIELVALFLSLTLGRVPVELEVAGDVAAVVVELDGSAVTRLGGPPWRAEIDLGADLRPHRLEAVALDDGGRELRRSRRFLNLYRSPAGVAYVLHRNSSGWLTMLELEWPARGGAVVERFAVSVDGRAVDAEDRTRVWVPPLDPASFHLIEIVGAYSDGSVSRDWLGFGGAVLGERSALLTPLQGRAGEHATARDARGQPVPVIAVEPAESEIVIVRDASVAQGAERLLPRRSVSGALSGARDAQAARLIHAVPVAEDEWLRMLDSSAPRGAGTLLDPHAVETRLTSEQPGDFGLLWHLRARASEAEPGPSWNADAVALAAARLSTGGRRAAVLLVLSGGASEEDASRLQPDVVRGYLEALGIPLEVWYLGKLAKAPRVWGAPREIRSVPDMETAIAELRAELERRAVIWVEGQYAPGEVTIDAGAS